MLAFLIYLVIVLIIMSLGWWILTMVPLPPPIKQIATVIFVVICAIILVYMLLGLVGTVPAPHWR